MDIELISTDELIDALMRRFDHCVFAGLRVESPKPTGLNIQFRGQHHTVMGLTTHAQIMVMADLKSKSKPVNEGSQNGD